MEEDGGGKLDFLLEEMRGGSNLAPVVGRDLERPPAWRVLANYVTLKGFLDGRGVRCSSDGGGWCLGAAKDFWLRFDRE